MPDVNRKQLLIIGAGSLVLLLLWRFYSARSGGAQQGDPNAMAPSNPGYADLAGQLQSAGAALQNQEQGDVQGLAATEAADIAELQASMATFAGQYSGLGDQLGGLGGRVDDLGGDITGITERINALAAGDSVASRTAAKSAAAAAKAAKAAAWDANPRHTKSFAQHERAVEARKAKGAHGHQETTHSAVAPSHHDTKPRVTARPHTTAHPRSGSHHVTHKAGTKPTQHTAQHSSPKRPAALTPKPPAPKPHKPAPRRGRAR